MIWIVLIILMIMMAAAMVLAMTAVKRMKCT